MDKQDVLKITGLIFIGLTLSFSTLNAQSKSRGGEKIGKTVKVKKKNISWEAYDTSSVISIDKIEPRYLQGLWSAYKGVYRFNGIVNAMELTEPFIVEFKDDTYRRTLKSTFTRFSITDNLIIKISGAKIDTGIINKITPTELTISWKDKSNFTRYYYEK
jgi:hypothetical protein